MQNPESSQPATPAGRPGRLPDWEAFYRDYRKPGYVRGFEITTKLGGGMFGLVFRARKQSIGKDYAIKFLQVDDTEVRRAVIAELEQVKLFAQIDHPNLVSIEDRGEVDGIPYLVMAFAGTQTLKDRLPTDGKLPTVAEREELLRYFLQACRGTAALHERSLVHFDIKPANIFLKGPVARIGDYGLSKLVTHSRGSLSMGRGTPYYMAPEMLQRRGDHRSDIYSLGIVLYELLCGSVPFRGDSEWEVLRKHEQEAPVLPDHLSLRERSVLQRCLQKDPAARFLSVNDLMVAMGAPASVAAAAMQEASAGNAGPGLRPEGLGPHESAPHAPPHAPQAPPLPSDDPFTGLRRASGEAFMHAQKIAKKALGEANGVAKKAVGNARVIAKRAAADARELLREHKAPSWWAKFRAPATPTESAPKPPPLPREPRRRGAFAFLMTTVGVLMLAALPFVWLMPVDRGAIPSPGRMPAQASPEIRVSILGGVQRTFTVPPALRGLVSTDEPAWVGLAAVDEDAAAEKLNARLEQIRMVRTSQNLDRTGWPKIEVLDDGSSSPPLSMVMATLGELMRASEFDATVASRLMAQAPASLALAAGEIAKLKWKKKSELEQARRLHRFLSEATGGAEIALVDDETLPLAKLAQANRSLGRQWSWFVNEIALTPATWDMFCRLQHR